jgi:hypothetical protein
VITVGDIGADSPVPAPLRKIPRVYVEFLTIGAGRRRFAQPELSRHAQSQQEADGNDGDEEFPVHGL